MGIEITKILGEPTVKDGSMIVSAKICDRTGQSPYNNKQPGLLHIGRSPQTEVLTMAYLEVASRNNDCERRWIPVSLTDVVEQINNWPDYKKVIGSVDKVIDRACRHATFCLVVCNGAKYLMPTSITVQLVTDAGRGLMPKR